MAADPKPLARLWLLAAIVVLAPILLGSIYVFWIEPEITKFRPPEKPGFVYNTMMMMNSPFLAPGIDRPGLVEAEFALVGDEEEVVGVVVKGQARAYLLEAMKSPTRHIVNDLIGETPATVTYCDLNDCVRVYTRPDSKDVLSVRQDGLREGRLVLSIAGHAYYQDTGAASAEDSPGFPLTVLEFTRAKWKDWRMAHPETLVYLGTPSGAVESERFKPQE